MSNQPFFSIIIPNYKTEPFLEECLESLRSQTFEDFEVIVINDGSPGVAAPKKNNLQPEELTQYWLRSDYTNQYVPKRVKGVNQCRWLFNKVAKKDSRFTLIEKENEGQGPARNLGINKSKGKRLVLLDCDDMLAPDFLEVAYTELLATHKSDVVFAQVKIYKEGKIIDFVDTQKYIPEVNNLKNMLVYPTWSINTVCYFWDLGILKKHGVKFPVPKKHGEDTMFVLDALIAYHLENPHTITKPFKELESCYLYRDFPLQNSKKGNFEIELFADLTSQLTERLPQLKNMGLVYYILGRLFIIRFSNYRTSLIIGGIGGLVLKCINYILFTFPSKLISGITKRKKK